MKQRHANDSFLHILDPALWRDSLLGRSTECTPVFVERYAGPRQGHALTTHNFWELTTVLAGCGRLEALGVLALRPHSTCLVPPGAPHREVSEEIMDTLWIGLKGSRLDHLDTRTIPNVHDEPLARQIEHLWMFAQKTMKPIGPELDAAAPGKHRSRS